MEKFCNEVSLGFEVIRNMLLSCCENCGGRGKGERRSSYKTVLVFLQGIVDWFPQSSYWRLFHSIAFSDASNFSDRPAKSSHNMFLCADGQRSDFDIKYGKLATMASTLRNLVILKSIALLEAPYGPFFWMKSTATPQQDLKRLSLTSGRHVFSIWVPMNKIILERCQWN